ncbi:8-amino-7-oxononanoate synthase [Paenibacillus sp. MBLB4367]|uniref:8-amino-7-oxononanoate synthase n=1 Tax=Paenibacillus sp. MBLB4367 TaxID=3384767 RepID=UPI0039083A9F
MSDVWLHSIREHMDQLTSAGLRRELRTIEDASRPILMHQGRPQLNLSSNNYLGLAGHPAIMEAERAAAKRGAGATASRLIVGSDLAHDDLERSIARFKGAESALVMANGYMANVGILPALLGRHDAAFSDRYNHASIVDGIRLSGANHFRYRHGDMDHLESLLRQADRKGVKRKLIVTDTVFSMDGDIAPLRDIVSLKEKYGAALMVDEAHGSGVYGPHGQGIAHHLGLEGGVDLHMGTFSKAFGVYGAYVTGSREWIRYLIQTCRSFIFSTALPPAVIGGIRQALELVEHRDDLRKDVLAKSARFRAGLCAYGFDTGGSETPIVPLLVGDEQRTLAFSRMLSESGIMAVAIRPPTVPGGTSRIRFTVTAAHEDADLERALPAIADIGKQLEVI